MADDEEPIETVSEDMLQNAETEIEVTPVHKNTPKEAKQPKKLSIFKRFWGVYRTKKKLAIPLTVVALLAVLYATALTRYAILGLVIKRDVRITIKDLQTATPISGVEVSVHGQSAKTDAQGSATIKGVKVGKSKLTAHKKYYKDLSADIVITLVATKGNSELRLEATGRQVPVHVTNKITGKDIADATIKAADTEAQTDKNGVTTLVLPVGPASVVATISAGGYNNLSVPIVVPSSALKDNTFALTPSGTVYFLSKQSGRIDVVKTDLDGGNRQTVLAGTGQEEDANTILLASRDWKYLALQSRRDNNRPGLYLIDTSNDKLTEMDSGDASFTPVGWHDHYFIYKASRNNVPIWEPKVASLKTFNAENLQLNVLDETNAEGRGDSDYATESIDNTYILKDSVVYTKRWYAGYYSVYRLAGKRMGIYSVKLAGTGKQTVKDFNADNNGSIGAVQYKPEQIYFSVSATNTDYYEFDNGVLKEANDITADIFNKFYPTYLVSPNGQNTFWYEQRDGKNTLFTGQQDGSHPTEVASLSEYIPYGWYGSDYLLVSKNDSELYILPASGPGGKGQVLKITDYHKPSYSFRGYGYGYGGF